MPLEFFETPPSIPFATFFFVSISSASVEAWLRSGLTPLQDQTDCRPLLSGSQTEICSFQYFRVCSAYSVEPLVPLMPTVWGGIGSCAGPPFRRAGKRPGCVPSRAAPGGPIAVDSSISIRNTNLRLGSASLRGTRFHKLGWACRLRRDN